MDEKETESKIEIGFKKAFFINAIPRISLSFEAPASSIVQMLASPQARALTIPIIGTAENLHSETACNFQWVTKYDNGEPFESEIVTGKLKPLGDKKFTLLINGAQPSVDIVKNRLFGKGVLGFSVKPNVPFGELFSFQPEQLKFNIPLDIKIEKTDNTQIGSKVTFVPIVSDALKNAKVRLTITESDVGENEFPDNKDPLYAFTWNGGEKKSIHWNVGFDFSKKMFFPEASEAGDVEFDYQLDVAFENEEFTTGKKTTRFLDKVKIPVLKNFKLTFKDNYLSSDAIWVSGEISGFSTDVEVPLWISLWKGKEHPVYYNGVSIEVVLDSNGKFSEELFDFGELNKRNERPKMSELFAVLMISEQVWTNSNRLSISTAIDFDDKKFVGFKYSYGFANKQVAKRICSEDVSYEEVKNQMGPSIQEAKVRAFMRMLRVGEGTVGEFGYQKIYGGESFVKDHNKGWNEHPNISITKWGKTSTAAGAYQILTRVWNDPSMTNWKKQYNITDFSPLNQDKAAVVILKHKRRNKVEKLGPKYENAHGDIIEMIIKDDFNRAVLTSSCEWSSLPDNPYGKGRRSWEQVKEDYENFLKEELEMKTDLHIAYGFLKDFGYDYD